MRSLLCLLICGLLLTGTLVSCDRKRVPPPSAMEILTAMQAAMTDTAQSLPDGLSYTRGVDGESPSYLTDTLFSALYGQAARGLFQPDSGEGGEGVPPIGDAALFLSISPYPCELAVFRCSDLRSAATVAGLCAARLDTVARGYRGSEWEAVARGGKVTVDGCYVLLAVAEDPDTVLACAKRLLP
ncbi:MAG: hypothetical protein IJA91_02355 [Clostridia bacterium]|nr:hypothetical protein [Clostridia bacterium]